MSCAKTVEPIDMPFEVLTVVGTEKHVLDGGADRCHLANTTEPSMFSGDTALWPLANYFVHLIGRCAVVCSAW